MTTTVAPDTLPSLTPEWMPEPEPTAAAVADEEPSPAPRHVLPRWLYDALEASAATHGGIGWGRAAALADDVDDVGIVPVCIYGHASLALGSRAVRALGTLTPPITPRASDNAVQRILGRARGRHGRVFWDHYCRAMGIVRGDE